MRRGEVETSATEQRKVKFRLLFHVSWKLTVVRNQEEQYKSNDHKEKTDKINGP